MKEITHDIQGRPLTPGAKAWMNAGVKGMNAFIKGEAEKDKKDKEKKEPKDGAK